MLLHPIYLQTFNFELAWSEKQPLIFRERRQLLCHREFLFFAEITSPQIKKYKGNCLMQPSGYDFGSMLTVNSCPWLMQMFIS